VIYVIEYVLKRVAVEVNTFHKIIHIQFLIGFFIHEEIINRIIGISQGSEIGYLISFIGGDREGITIDCCAYKVLIPQR